MLNKSMILYSNLEILEITGILKKQRNLACQNYIVLINLHFKVYMRIIVNFYPIIFKWSAISLFLQHANTPLHITALKGIPSITELLLKYNAPTNILNKVCMKNLYTLCNIMDNLCQKSLGHSSNKAFYMTIISSRSTTKDNHPLPS